MSDRKSGQHRDDKPVSSGAFVDGEFKSIETTLPEPEIRRLPSVFSGSALAFVNEASESRRKTEDE